MSKKKFTHGMTFSTEGSMYEKLVEEANRQKVSLSCVIRQALVSMMEDIHKELADMQAEEVRDEPVE